MSSIGEDLTIKYEMSTDIYPEGEHWVENWFVEARVVDTTYKEVFAARGKFLIIPEGCNLFESLYNICDEHSQELTELYERHKQPLERALDVGDVMLIDAIQVEPEFRGMEVGRYIMNDILNRFVGRCTLVLCKPYPMEQRIPLATAKRKLRKYWKPMGFVQMAYKSDYFVYLPERRTWVSDVEVARVHEAMEA